MSKVIDLSKSVRRAVDPDSQDSQDSQPLIPEDVAAALTTCKCGHHVFTPAGPGLRHFACTACNRPLDINHAIFAMVLDFRPLERRL